METTLEVSDASHVAEVRRTVSSVGQRGGCTAELIAQAALVATELSTNILKYAGRGSLALSMAKEGDSTALDILALDNGPGIPNFALSARDGHSTGGSLGFGIGTVQRAASVFDVYSGTGLGTAIFARITARRHPPAAEPRFRVGSRMTAIRTETVSGDAWTRSDLKDGILVSVIDGLGHGPKAAEAAAQASQVVEQRLSERGPAETIRAAHDALRATRGAVMALAKIDARAGTLRFSGVGNISAMVFDGQGVTRLVSTDGTVGYSLRTPRESEAAWTSGSTLVMNTDGLFSKWNLSAHPGLLSHHPALIAAVLHRDFARNTDDATVVVVKGG
ncbi:MAG: hypothetical protein JWQ03_2939 [Variovorax sp.]|nr:hypothetical protein [Variovorax sp.]